MFTGIVAHCGRILESAAEPAGLRLKIETEFASFEMGESIAVDGCCLTVVSYGLGYFEVQLSPETLTRTVAAGYRSGVAVHLERALRMGDRLGGHWVTGHIDGRGRIQHKKALHDYFELQVALECPHEPGWLMPKGSIAINGVSLTVNDTMGDAFSVMVIPHTAERTTLGSLCEGDSVSLEFDWLAKVVCRQTSAYRAEEK